MLHQFHLTEDQSLPDIEEFVKTLRDDFVPDTYLLNSDLIAS
jgi:hypothetical protein